jgi:hypothetical protein
MRSASGSGAVSEQMEERLIGGGGLAHGQRRPYGRPMTT